MSLKTSSLSTPTVLSTVSSHLQLLTVRGLGSHPHSRTRREIEKATVNVEIDLALLKLSSLHRGSGRLNNMAACYLCVKNLGVDSKHSLMRLAIDW